ncbi:uncharacterized protein LOC125244397 [Megalobrama amblycephala]|uniref:uncharacterized protein LOC125244397 n=1 Tax=Megalobrama amblycephala TaxID=75352 RepID=UPI002014414F|nr:uncharacterized protein LOC125244397 [Megalobrama amblycephala]
MTPKQRTAELPPISHVPVMQNVVHGAIRTQSAQQTLPLNEMSSVHSIPSSCFVSPQFPTAPDTALQGQLLPQSQYEGKSPPELRRCLGVEGAPFWSKQQWATNPPTGLHSMQRPVPLVYTDCQPNYPGAHSDHYPAQQVTWPQYGNYQAAPPPPINLYGAPKPSIPDFAVDSEKDFANLKLALDNLLDSHPELSEKYKYHVLLEHLKLPEAQMIGQSCRHEARPYTAAMQALQLHYGQPHQLAQSEIAAILNAPDVKVGDASSLQSFALRVHLLVSMLLSLEGPRGIELSCCSHVDRLLSKLPKYLRDNFIEFLQMQGKLNVASLNPYNLQDFSGWLQGKAQQQRLSSRLVERYQREKSSYSLQGRASTRSKGQGASVYHGTEPQIVEAPKPVPQPPQWKKSKVHCLFCHSKEHYITQCSEIKEQSTENLMQWISEGKRCWKCGRSHRPEDCNLKKPCGICGEIHLQVLHGIAEQRAKVKPTSALNSRIYLTPSSPSGRVLLKVVPVLLHNKDRTIETFAILDDGAEQPIQESGTESRMPSLQMGLDLVEQSYPIKALRRRYAHLRDIPLQSFKNVQPLLLIGSDNSPLITAVKTVHVATQVGPVAVRTKLGWALQGPEGLQNRATSTQSYFITASATYDTLYRDVERLWQLDSLPYRSEKLMTRSKQDQESIKILDSKTCRVSIDGIQRYATPLLRTDDSPKLNAPQESVLANLRSTERRLKDQPEKAAAYRGEMNRLIQAGYVKEITAKEVNESEESWYLPHHLVYHNGKARLVFNCSFVYKGTSLNEQLLPGPNLGPSLLGVLLRFRQHSVAISGDIKGMFHQVRLLPEDRPLLRFLWRDLQREIPPQVYEWQVLPFGTTSSPCCAIYALQKHIKEHPHSTPDLIQSVESSFYVDNCLESLPTAAAAKTRLDDLRAIMADGGFEIRQWTSNRSSVVAHLPSDARSQDMELWLEHHRCDLQEPTLGLCWNCETDTLGYRYRPIEHSVLTMRTVYKILASQYDPLGFITPYTTRAKILIQQLWSKKRDWDDPDLPADLRESWNIWESELPHLSTVSIPRCYVPVAMDNPGLEHHLHVFCDASERAYGAVAYLSTTHEGLTNVSFIMARSKVAPKRQQTMPRLELCAALAGAQLAKLIQTELSSYLQQTTLWTDSTTVLEWLQSESCRFKVFVGTRVSEIQELTDQRSWRYVDSLNNPADDLTRGKTLLELTVPSRWSNGPSFLLQAPDKWPKKPHITQSSKSNELKGLTFCSFASVLQNIPDANQFDSWTDLVEAVRQQCHGAAEPNQTQLINSYREAEAILLRACQAQSFSEELVSLRAGQPVHISSKLRNLAPELDQTTDLIRVGGRLRQLQQVSDLDIHPIVLDPRHPATMLLIKDYDERLLHAGSERLFAEIRRQYWILRGRQVIKKYQLHCPECQKWRAQPKVPQMADLPMARLRIFRPPFFSTGVDCFGPFIAKIGRRNEKRWGVIFKCLTTRAIHLDLLNSLDSDAFLLALRRFIARRGKPAEIISDQGTNFKGADRELQTAFKELEPQLQQKLVNYQIDFKFNPPNAPHFGGAWEREIRSIKSALQVAVGTQSLSEDVLHTILVEVEGILNSKPLGYVSADVANPDPITPNMLLMGRRDASLPQAVYASETIGRRRWRHCQNLIDQFWIRYLRDYLPTLHSRYKWQKPTEPLTLDTVVMIIDPNLPRAQWPIGRVVKLIPSRDGCIRTVEIQVRDKIYTRPVARLVPLPGLPDNTENLQT